MLISILACSLGFHTITLEQSFYKNLHFKNEAGVPLNPLVSLFRRIVARGGRKRAENTHRQTDTQTKYCNPCCACTPGVIEVELVIIMLWEHLESKPELTRVTEALGKSQR